MSLPKDVSQAVNSAEPLRLKHTDYGFVPQLDADHDKLFDNVERVRQSMALRDTSEIAFTTWKLSRSLSAHLASEERMMRRLRYPALRWHQQQHEAGRKRMAKLRAAVSGSNEPEIADRLNALAKWLTDHIALADRMFAAHLRNNRRESLVS